jgi:hypothetical protein
MKCPSCGSLDVRLSKRQPPFGFVYTLQGFERYRCRGCRHAYWEKPPKNDEERIRRKRQRAWGSFIQSRNRRSLIELALFIAMLVIFFVTIRYLVTKTGEGSPPAGIGLISPPTIRARFAAARYTDTLSRCAFAHPLGGQ